MTIYFITILNKINFKESVNRKNPTKQSKAIQ